MQKIESNKWKKSITFATDFVCDSALFTISKDVKQRMMYIMH